MPAQLIQFDEFSLDCDRYRLLRSGRPVKLEKIPMELLILLASKDGKLVTRQEIIERLWGKDVFVDTEHGINTAVRKIRKALRDDPEQPRFVLTVTGKGYRFVRSADESKGRHSAQGANGNGSNGTESAVAPNNGVRETLALVDELITADGNDVDLAKVTDNATTTTSSRVLKSTDLAPMGRMPVVLTGVIAVVVVIAGTALFLNIEFGWGTIFSRAPGIQSLAVLPLEDLSHDASQEYLSDGITDALITDLGKIDGLRVISRQSVMQFAERGGFERRYKCSARITV